MRRQRQLRHDDPSGTQQFDLFDTGSGGSAPPAPEWRALPAPTRQALTALMTRLICDHTAGDHHPQPSAMISEKIRPHHLERKAILYVRQSSPHQVLHNRESSALQYAMRDRLIALGWSADAAGLTEHASAAKPDEIAAAPGSFIFRQ